MNQDDDDERKRVLKDGEKLVVSLAMMDATQRAVASAHGVALDVAHDLSLHRQGYRIVSTDAAAAARREEAYQQAVRASEQRWKSPQRIEADREAAADQARIETISAADSWRIRSEAW